MLDRDSGGGLLVTDHFLKAYLARPELTPPPEACAAEKSLHFSLLADPRRPVRAAEIAVIADALTSATSSSRTGPWRGPTLPSSGSPLRCRTSS
jgi:hypothetical protein